MKVQTPHKLAVGDLIEVNNLIFVLTKVEEKFDAPSSVEFKTPIELMERF